MPNYQEANRDVCDTVAAVMKKHHPELIEAGVTVKTLLAFPTKEGGACLTHQGYPAAATIRINDLKARVAGMDDALLLIDGEAMESWSQKRLEALIDHELTHLEVQYDDEGKVKTDDAERPKLKIKKHDAQVGVFFSIMEKHGKEALDTEIVAKLAIDTKEWITPMLQWG